MDVTRIALIRRLFNREPRTMPMAEFHNTRYLSWSTEREMQLQASDRRIMCERISNVARLRGLDADWEKVNRQYKVWLEWYHGRMLTGYLIRMTGVKHIEQP